MVDEVKAKIQSLEEQVEQNSVKPFEHTALVARVNELKLKKEDLEINLGSLKR